MEKAVLDKRLNQMRRRAPFRAGVRRGSDLTADQLDDRYDAIVLAIGATVPRPGRTRARAPPDPPGDGVPAAVQPASLGARSTTRSPPRASTS